MAYEQSSEFARVAAGSRPRLKRSGLTGYRLTLPAKAPDQYSPQNNPHLPAWCTSAV